MRKTSYELANLSFNDKTRKNDYLITPKEDEKKYEFTIPDVLTSIRKIYPGDHIKSTCISEISDPLVKQDDKKFGRIII